MAATDLEKEIFDDVEEIDEEILRMTADAQAIRSSLALPHQWGFLHCCVS